MGRGGGIWGGGQTADRGDKGGGGGAEGQEFGGGGRGGESRRALYALLSGPSRTCLCCALLSGPSRTCLCGDFALVIAKVVERAPHTADGVAQLPLLLELPSQLRQPGQDHANLDSLWGGGGQGRSTTLTCTVSAAWGLGGWESSGQMTGLGYLT